MGVALVQARESCARSACFRARARNAMPRDGSPWAIAILPWSRQSSDSRAGWTRSRSSGGLPSASVA